MEGRDANAVLDQRAPARTSAMPQVRPPSLREGDPQAVLFSAPALLLRLRFLLLLGEEGKWHNQFLSL